MKHTIRKSAIALAAAAMLVLTGCGTALQETVPAASNVESQASENSSEATANAIYADKLFDASYVHQIDITISDADWSDLTENPMNKTKYEVAVSIDGETIESVSFATKGNTSLSSVAGDPDSDRYSFKVNFGKYVDGQTYYGLNKLNLNNLYADATFMKDYISYEIFRQAGVAAPLTSYVWLTVNGKAQGLYLAIEDISESYLTRTNDGEGELYKPETDHLDNVGKMGGDQLQPPQNDGQPPQMPDGERPTPPEGADFADRTPPEGMERPELPENGEMPEAPGDGKMPDRGGMPFGESSNGADLAYSDDSIESYSDIFENDETDADDAAKQRVIAALKGLSEGTDLESCLDTDEVIRYFAAHNFVLNYDSYTGNMLHNYYLYEKDGKLSMLPWDYNLAFGGFASGHGKDSTDDATALVNTGIDTPLSGTDASARPMWAWITENADYLAQYHQVYDELLTSYFASGAFAGQIDSLYEMLLPYIEKDTGAFYDAEAFQAGYAALKQFCLLRAESIRAQLDGTLSSDTAQQDTDKQIPATDIRIAAMGTHGGGAEGRFPDAGRAPRRESDAENRQKETS